MSTLIGKTILLIDDSKDTTLIAKRIIEGSGGRFISAESVKEGLMLAQTSSPHLIITDIVMPVHSGFVFLEKKNKIPDLEIIPTLVLSSLNDRTSVQKAIALGAADFILKPITAGTLLKKIRKTLKLTSQNTFNFLSHSAEPPPTGEVELPASITNVNESGFQLQSSVRLSQSTDIRIDAPLLNQLECDRSKIRVSWPNGRPLPEGQYVHDFKFVGINGNQAREIREKLKKGAA